VRRPSVASGVGGAEPAQVQPTETDRAARAGRAAEPRSRRAAVRPGAHRRAGTRSAAAGSRPAAGTCSGMGTTRRAPTQGPDRSQAGPAVAERPTVRAADRGRLDRRRVRARQASTGEAGAAEARRSSSQCAARPRRARGLRMGWSPRARVRSGGADLAHGSGAALPGPCRGAEALVSAADPTTSDRRGVRRELPLVGGIDLVADQRGGLAQAVGLVGGQRVEDEVADGLDVTRR